MRKIRQKLAVGASIVALLLGVGAANAGEKPLPSGTVRLAGADRYATSAAISAKSFTAPVDAVFVATGRAFPDALSGGPAAASLGGPVLLVSKDSIRPEVKQEIQRLQPGTIYVLGGSGVISTNVAKELSGLTGAKVKRLSGAGRYETAATVAQEVWPSGASTVFLASGTSFPDALGGGAAAAHRDAPLLLTSPTKLSPATRAELRRLKPSRIFVLGGEAAVSKSVVSGVQSALPSANLTRLSGADRYATSARIANAIWPQGANTVFYATGTAFPDALSGTPAAHVNSAPLVLAKKDCVDLSVMEVRDTFAPRTLALVGGTGVLPSPALNKVCGVTASGVGDSVFRINKPGGATNPAIVTATHNGSRNFIVWGLDSNREYNDPLVNEIGPYSGRTILDEGPFNKPSNFLQIDADGRWTITIKKLSTARALTSNTSGKGDDVLKWGGSSRTARLTHNGSSNFIVWAYDANGDLHDLIVNDIGSYNGTRVIPSGTRYLSVEADGNWTIKLQ